MEVVVTGIGPLLPNCSSRGSLWSQLSAGPSQLAFEAAPGAEGESWAVGRVQGFDPDRYLARFERAHYQRYHRELQIYLASLAIALDDAGLDSIAGDRTALVDGTSRGNQDYWYARARDEHRCGPAELYTRRELVAAPLGQAANLAASLFGVRGPVQTVNATCCSGAVAIGHAIRELALGEVDVALASGHDAALNAPTYHMYRDAGLLSDERDDARRAVRPYVESTRNAFGEGAVTLVLETRAHAEARGAQILAVVGGYRLGNVGGHPTNVDPEGERAAQIAAAVLDRAGVAREEVGFVVGHGNGVAQSDRSELAYMDRLFGARRVPLISVKPVYGHLLGASSALNVAAAALMLHARTLAPTLNLDPAHAGRFDHVAGGARATDAAHGLAMSYGVGGHNASVLLSRAA